MLRFDFFDYYVTSIQFKIASWTLITTTSFGWDFIGRCYLTTVYKAQKHMCNFFQKWLILKENQYLLVLFSLVALIFGIGIDSVHLESFFTVSSVPGWMTWRPFWLLFLPILMEFCSSFAFSLSLMLNFLKKRLECYHWYYNVYTCPTLHLKSPCSYVLMRNCVVKNRSLNLYQVSEFLRHIGYQMKA